MKRRALSRLRDIFKPSLENRPHHSVTLKGFGHHFRKAMGWILVFTAFVHVLEVMGFLIGFEVVPLDALLRIHDRQVSRKVVIVEITDADYSNRDLFGGKSPLDSQLLAQLASAVQKYGPAVIGMDFDTESFDTAKVKADLLARMLPGDQNSSPNAAPHVPVVWAEVPCNTVEPLMLGPILGGRLHDSDYFGIPRFPVDSDGMVRRYQGKFEVAGTFEPCPAKFVHTIDKNLDAAHNEAASKRSFARAVIDHACQNINFDCSSRHVEAKPNALWSWMRRFLRPICSNNTDCLSLFEDAAPSVIFNFYGDRYRFPIIQAHEFIGKDAEASANDQNLQSQRAAILRDKIVLIGGSFNAARDVYMTPLGQMAGVELIALAVQSDFGGGIRETQKILEILADIFVGTLIVFLYFYYEQRPVVAFYLSLFGVPVMATLFSLILFRSAAYWFSFMPIIIGMVLHQMLELSKSCGKLQHEVHDLKLKLDKSAESARESNTVVLVEVNPIKEKTDLAVEKSPDKT